MKLGVFNPAFYHKSFEEALNEISRLGLEAIEIGCGGYPGNKHCDVELLLRDPESLSKFQRAINDRGLFVSALSCHGNPLHPSREIAQEHRKAQENSVLLAEKLGVDRIVTFSGCPGDGENSGYPNWVTSSWPEDYRKLLDWQWKEKVVPYWKDAANFAQKHGVEKICIEMHPGFVAYNVETLLRLRKEAGRQIVANFDPSHMFWQGVEPSSAIVKLGGETIGHFHAKDVQVFEDNTRVNGVLDAKSYADLLNRAWIFRTVGYGHSLIAWKKIMSSLRLVGYDYVISIEHEDALLSREEGIRSAVSFLKQAIISEPPSEAWWI